ncbi:MAG: phosphoribosylglycinamide formyltransferase [Steroidobacteraceae bacterium]|nr:phosphoribosylglycinamide formyltransferase [Steroidobacteraceae bacterium]
MSSAAAPLRVAILLSGRGSNMAAIARGCAAGEIAARIELVLADRADAAGLDLARGLGLAAAAVPRAGFADREAFEAELRRRIDACDPGLVVLAGFMRVLGPRFVAAYAGRLLNVHPSLLPRHKGLGTHQKVLDAGEPEHGASVHFVTADLDGGPVVLQARVPVLPDDDPARLSARVQRCEHIIYPRVVQWFAAGRLRCDAAGVVLDGRPLAAPLVEDFDAVTT